MGTIMNFSTALQLFIASISYKSVVSTSANSIQDKVGDGCVNRVDFSSTFNTDDGDICDSCAFCNGSNLNSIFLPESGGICVECSEVECKNLNVTTTFQTPFNLKFLPMSFSGVTSDMYPKSIVVEGSNDLLSWSELYRTTDLEKG